MVTHITPSGTGAKQPVAVAQTKDAAGSNAFRASLTDATSTPAEFHSGRLTVHINSRTGQPDAVTFRDAEGRAMRRSGFVAQDILRHAHEQGIPLVDLRGLGAQLDAAGIGYRPYELYPGTGSDHGIDFEDLIAGGLGTAYDWTNDPHIAQKGRGAQRLLAADQALASRLGLVKNPEVTREAGIDPGRFRPSNQGPDAAPRSYVAFNGAGASWHDTRAEAEQAATRMNGRVIDLNPTNLSGAPSTLALASPNLTGPKFAAAPLQPKPPVVLSAASSPTQAKPAPLAPRGPGDTADNVRNASDAKALSAVRTGLRTPEAASSLHSTKAKAALQLDLVLLQLQRHHRES